MKNKASRKPFNDPFDELSDEDFEREVLESLNQATTKISLRVPKDLLSRTFVVGIQKIVSDLDEGLRRIDEYSYPLEDARRPGRLWRSQRREQHSDHHAGNHPRPHRRRPGRRSAGLLAHSPRRSISPSR